MGATGNGNKEKTPNLESSAGGTLRGRIKKETRISPALSITLVKLGIITLVYTVALTVGFFIYQIVR